MANNWIFWDEMWNSSASDKKEPITVCCGDWDEEGKCNCKK